MERTSTSTDWRMNTATLQHDAHYMINLSKRRPSVVVGLLSWHFCTHGSTRGGLVACVVQHNGLTAHRMVTALIVAKWIAAYPTRATHVVIKRK